MTAVVPRGDALQPLARHGTRSAEGPLARLLRTVREDAGRESVTPRTAWVVALAPLVGGALFMALFVLARPLYYVLLQEDQVVEWSQFALCTFAALAALSTSARYLVLRRRVSAVLFVLAGVALMVLAGEEISWGQRVFGLAEPERLGAVNRQAELNVHNVALAGLPLDDVFKQISLLLGVAGVAVALLTRVHRPLGRGRLWWEISPPLLTVPGFLLMIPYRPLVQRAPAGGTAPLERFQEWVEVGLYLAIAATVVCCYRRALPGRAVEGVDGVWRLGAGGARAGGAGRAVLLPVLAVGVAVVTVVFAVLTARSGILPGNL